MVNRVKPDQDFPCFCTFTKIIITFLSFELQKWFSSQNRSEFNQEFNSELTFLLDLTSFLIPRGTKVPFKYHYEVRTPCHVAVSITKLGYLSRNWRKHKMAQSQNDATVPKGQLTLQNQSPSPRDNRKIAPYCVC